jgi:hypothetical protein
MRCICSLGARRRIGRTIDRSLRDLARELASIDTPVSATHLHDIEHGRRVPSRRLTGALRKVLLLDRRYVVEWVPARAARVRVSVRAASPH